MFEKYVYLTLIKGGQEKENHSQQIPTFRCSEWSNLSRRGETRRDETTSTMPVNHISELKLYNKIIGQYNIKPTVHWL